MNRIDRQPESAANQMYDLIVIGGGIYGACATLEAARRGLHTLLIERDDFGAATSWNSLRILHGGLRYLQSLDLKRFRESVEQRRWFIQHFPELTQPLACLMPLDGRGLRRPIVLRAAVFLNDRLSARRNRGVRADRCLSNGRVLNADQTGEIFPQIQRKGLRGAVMWHDALMTNSQRILIEMIRWACAGGATALNYVRCDQLLVHHQRVGGVRAVDQTNHRVYEYRAKKVLNCAGPWCRRLAAGFDRDIEDLYRPSLAMNLLLDRSPMCEAALALTPPGLGARTYFFVPWRNRILAGTFHTPWTAELSEPTPTDQHIETFLSDLNSAAPNLQLQPHDVLRVYAGFMPTTPGSDCEPAHRPVWRDHGGNGGPNGLFTLSGVKWTTAQLEAQRAVERLFPDRRVDPQLDDWPIKNARVAAVDWNDPQAWLDGDASKAKALAHTIASQEAVVRLDDLLLRRTGWGAAPGVGDQVARRVGDWLNLQDACG